MNLTSDQMAATQPFAALVGVAVTEATAESVTGRMAWSPERCTAGGIMHGGALMALADALGGLCAFLNLTEGATTATVESKTNFFRPVRKGTVTGTASVLHKGRTLITVQTNLHDDEGRLVAQTTQTQAVIVGGRS